MTTLSFIKTKEAKALIARLKQAPTKTSIPSIPSIPSFYDPIEHNLIDHDFERKIIEINNQQVYEYVSNQETYRPGYATGNNTWREKNLHGPFEFDRWVHRGTSTTAVEEDLFEHTVSGFTYLDGKRIKTIVPKDKSTNPPVYSCHYEGFDATTALFLKFSDWSTGRYQQSQKFLLKSLLNEKATSVEQIQKFREKYIEEEEKFSEAKTIIFTEVKNPIMQEHYLKKNSIELDRARKAWINAKNWTPPPAELIRNITKNFKTTSSQQFSRQIFYETNSIPFGKSSGLRAMQLSLGTPNILYSEHCILPNTVTVPTLKQVTSFKGCTGEKVLINGKKYIKIYQFALPKPPLHLEQKHLRVEEIKKWVYPKESYKKAYAWRNAIEAVEFNYDASRAWQDAVKAKQSVRDPLDVKVSNWFDRSQIYKRLFMIEPSPNLHIQVNWLRKSYKEHFPNLNVDLLFGIHPMQRTIIRPREEIKVLCLKVMGVSLKDFDQSLPPEEGEITPKTSRVRFRLWLEKNRPEKLHFFDTVCKETEYSLKELTVLLRQEEVQKDLQNTKERIIESSRALEEFVYDPSMRVTDLEKIMDMKASSIKRLGHDFVDQYMGNVQDAAAYRYDEDLDYSLGSVEAWYDDNDENNYDNDNLDYEQVQNATYQMKYRSEEGEADEFSRYLSIDEPIDRLPITYWSSDSIPRNSLYEYQPEMLRAALKELYKTKNKWEAGNVYRSYSFRFDQGELWHERCVQRILKLDAQEKALV